MEDAGRPILKSLLFFVAMLCFVGFGQFLLIPGADVCAFWPANALIFAILLCCNKKNRILYGRLALPAYFMGEIIAGFGPIQALGYSMANLMAIQIGIYLLKRLGKKHFRINNGYNLLLFLVITTLISLIAGIAGATIKAFTVAKYELATNFLNWFLADLTGYIVIATPILTTGKAMKRQWRSLERSRKLELIVGLLLLVQISFFIFETIRETPSQFSLNLYLPIPLLLWMGIRFRIQGAALAASSMSLVAIGYALTGSGPFSGPIPMSNMHGMQLFIALIYAMVMAIASVFQERAHAHDALKHTRDELENRVRLRTATLARINHSLMNEISERKRAEMELRQAATVFAVVEEGIIVADARNHIISVNPAFCQTTGYTEAEIIGKSPNILKSGRHGPEFYREMWRNLNQLGKWQGEIWNRRKSGEIYPEWLSISTVYDGNNQVVKRIGVFLDITERKLAEETIRHQATFDPVTDLPNRFLFQERLKHEVALARRHQSELALMFLDLDKFKDINDTLGHKAGDELLIEVANRIKACVRSTDMVARLGGDEFTILLPIIKSPNNAMAIAESLVENMQRPFSLMGKEIFITCSVGITIFPDDGITPEQLLQNADEAMYRAKERGRNAFKFFTPEMNLKTQERLAIISELHLAIEHQEFQLYYQPIVDLSSDRVVKAEALIRWKSPNRGLVSPDQFIPVAEDTGLIIPIGEWVITEAARQLDQWRKNGFEMIRVSVNFSARQCRKGLKDHWIDKVLKQFGVPPSMLTLEFTETILFEDVDETIEQFSKLRQEGMEIALDDFGTGFSSLSYLKKFPVDLLKIDRSFIGDFESNKGDRALVEAILSMSKSLGIKVIAEGVETPNQARFLMQRGCEMAQGYAYAQPLPANEFVDWLTHYNHKLSN